ncbi:MAG TPA: hypothetical protein VMF66_00015 [Candidatus Acidoferrum sp.]|nr:hypothetical protein [Candidatus Acidoferrum sp.]
MTQKKVSITVRGGRLAVLIALAVVGVLFSASGAKAGCGYPTKLETVPPIPSAAPHGDQQNGGGPNQSTSIVGLWYVVWTATYTTSGPLPLPIVPPAQPFVVNQSFKTWHSDGTEFDNVFLPPSGGNICYGVWKDMGNRIVKVRHVGLMFGPDGSLANIFWQEETDTLSADGKTYEGTFDQKLYDPTDIFGTGPVVQEIRGRTAAKRVTVD